MYWSTFLFSLRVIFNALHYFLDYLNFYPYYQLTDCAILLFPGRVNIVELQAALNVDLSHIESKVNVIIGTEKNLTLVLGQLIDRCVKLIFLLAIIYTCV